VAHWIAAHELVSTYVPATGASKWTAGQRPLADESDPKAWLELVEDDEFPLSIFYSSLAAKIGTGDSGGGGAASPGGHPPTAPRVARKAVA
jgi:hypothetical protein